MISFMATKTDYNKGEFALLKLENVSKFYYNKGIIASRFF